MATNRVNQRIDPDRTDRLLAVVKGFSTKYRPEKTEDMVMVWPSLLVIEAITALVFLLGIALFSVVQNAPLEELASPNVTPAIAKAPWYFLGLQELLHYFPPVIAGVMIPTVIVVWLIALPYLDRNPSRKPSDRKITLILFTMFIIFGAVITILGALFRGPGWTWTWPWEAIYFSL